MTPEEKSILTMLSNSRFLKEDSPTKVDGWLWVLIAVAGVVVLLNIIAQVRLS